MCGRYTIGVNYNKLNEIVESKYNINEIPEFNLPRFNVAPMQDVISIINDGKKYRIGTFKWGFIPYFANSEKIGYKMINARKETLANKPVFKHSFLHKRCVILADGFYEWKKVNNEKIPIRYKLKNEELFSFAGLWSTYTREDNSKLYTCTIITTEPNKIVSPIHNRMPVILNDEAEKLWLNPNIMDLEMLSSLLNPYDSEIMEAYQVSKVVNNVKNDTIDCIIPV